MASTLPYNALLLSSPTIGVNKSCEAKRFTRCSRRRANFVDLQSLVNYNVQTDK